MPILLRRLRAALFLAALWALIAGAVGVLTGVWFGVRQSPYPVLPDVGQWWFEWHTVVLNIAARWVAAGGTLGLVFAGVLAAAERGRDVRRLSGARAAAWGAVAGIGFLLVGVVRLALTRGARGTAGLTGIPYLLVAFSALFGAGCAWLTLRCAHRGAGAVAHEDSPGDVGLLSGTTPADPWPTTAETSQHREPVA